MIRTTSPSWNTAPALTLDDALVDFVISQVRRIFGEMFLTEVGAQSYFFDREAAFAADISAVVGLVQDESEGVLTVSFESEAILGVLSRIYGARYAVTEKPVQDGVGEISNVLYCIFKKKLNEGGHRLRMALPTVIVGPCHELHDLHRDGRSLTIEFQLPEGRFFVRILLQRR